MYKGGRPLFCSKGVKQMKDYGVNTGLRLTTLQLEKADRLAASLGMSRNKTIGLLIEAAEVQTKPTVLVGEMKNSSDSAKFSQDASAITASA